MSKTDPNSTAKQTTDKEKETTKSSELNQEDQTINQKPKQKKTSKRRTKKGRTSKKHKENSTEPSSPQQQQTEEKKPKINYANAAKSITGRVFAIASAAVAVAALGAAWPAAVATIAVIATAMVIDTAVVTHTKSLYKEAKYLDRHRSSRQKQDAMLKKYPNIATSLADDLYQPKTEGKSKKEQKSRNISDGQRKTENIVKTVLYSTMNVLVNLAEGIIARNPQMILAAVRIITHSTLDNASTQALMSKQRENLRNFIDSERVKEDAPGYDNTLELRKAAREQKIQELALQKMEEHAKKHGIDLNTASPETIKLMFEHKKKEVIATEKTIRDSNTVTYHLRQFGKSFIQAHDDKSKFHDPKQMAELTPKTTEDKTKNTELTKTEAHQAAIKIGEKLHDKKNKKETTSPDGSKRQKKSKIRFK